MEGPRSPAETEYGQVLKFLDQQLRPGSQWSIEAEYPTALNLSNLGNIRIITEEKKVLSHAVLKPLIVKTPLAILKVAAIGSVATDESHRNQGLSRQILENCLEEARRQECDIAMLWTNLYDFYRKLNFELAGSEVSVVIEQEFSTPDAQGIKFVKGTQVSAEALQRLYSQHTVTSVRSVEDVRKFLRIPQTQAYTAWDNQGQLLAYAIEGKGIDLSGYIHEWGGKVPALLSLLSFIRREKKAPFTVIMPRHSENFLLKLQALPVTINHGYLGMMKIVNYDGLFAKVKRAARSLGISDLVLERRGPDFIFGIGTEIVVISDERALTQVLFGPLPIIDLFSEKTWKTLEKVFPLPLWVWGWDSI